MPRPDRSRSALVDSAAVLFRRQGYAATGVNQILETADVKAGSLYHHFPDGKAQLAAAVVERVGSDIERRLREALAADLPVTEIVDGWIDLMAAGLAGDQRDGCPIEPIATESVNASAAVRTASAAVFDRWRRAISERLRADGWPQDDADRTGLALIALIEGALMLARVAGDRATLEAAKAAARTLLATTYTAR
ncbi:TetR/AcrR family transcriptional regulator [Mycolicibacterium flavescens]|uniref:TetR family transcriptional regulator n=1 Tax=Mycolicibacterium flavescens TaxID=1776 RepID=A0A1E3RQ49_MYCFV|nr:TetR/AcrR family transcriptional regulator [Mycolicibacterium flavescens]MCV7279414.1 TetR/AcrR family transcriptional regulator [Mycolicibacterium flavescens]ODQ91978.1 TetR family transcriptional regulator [Mycolicibacterium flavescens]